MGGRDDQTLRPWAFVVGWSVLQRCLEILRQTLLTLRIVGRENRATDVDEKRKRIVTKLIFRGSTV